MFDLVIRGGSVFDGLGNAPLIADIGINGEFIQYVGPNARRGAEEIDARGMIVTPGFVDIHTHYDAQATWDPLLAPSSIHGVTTVVMGNCGVGFAPVRPDARGWLMEVMENVEEIPREVLEAGLRWNWETFPQYLDALDAVRRVIDVGAQVTHIPLRGYVMGERAARDEPATVADIAAMARLVEEGLRAGGVGFSCSRTNFHRTSAGELVPGSMGNREELLGLSDAVKHAGGGVIQCLSDMSPAEDEFGWMEEMSIRGAARVGFSLFQSPVSDRDWRWQMQRLERTKVGANLVGHIASRGVGNVMQWQATVHPFIARATWKAIATRPWPQQLEKLRDPAVRRQILSEPNEPSAVHSPELLERMLNGFGNQFELDGEFDFEPDPTTSSIAVRAKDRGVDPAAYAYDVLMRDDGRGLIYLPIVNYDDGNLDHIREMLFDRNTVLSLSDAGAHCTRVMDAVSPTFMLTHWGRDRKRGALVPLPQIIRAYTSDTAASYDFNDRGVLASRYLADVNVIDFERLKLKRPYMGFDMPAGGRRLLQDADGYVATIKRGQVTFREGRHTGVTPGKVIRGAQIGPGGLQ